MKILVDADACPVKNIIIRVAKEYRLPVIMFIDTSHVLSDGYSEVITVDKSADSVDIALINKTSKGDIVVTQDYGVAALALPKGAYTLNQNGLIYTQDNIDKLLFERFMSAKVRRAGGRTSGPRKRTKDDDDRFERAFRNLCSTVKAQGN
ncbi:MAG: YaiI/YqxD family protein [Clostridia bacterium]|nr:YaiI/YqxD family protein [Clostridia bacterium]